MNILNGRNSFYQWDKDQKITSSIFNEGDEVHFDNGCLPKPLTVLVKEVEGCLVADVPNILLQQFGSIVAYHYIKNEEDGSYTINKHYFDVLERPKPADYIYTETEILNYEHLETAIEDVQKSLAEKTKVWYAKEPAYATLGQIAIESMHTVMSLNPPIEIGEILRLEIANGNTNHKYVLDYKVETGEYGSVYLVYVGGNIDDDIYSVYAYDQTDIVVETAFALGKVVASTLRYEKLPKEYLPENFATKEDVENLTREISNALDDLHIYAQNLIGGN